MLQKYTFHNSENKESSSIFTWIINKILLPMYKNVVRMFHLTCIQEIFKCNVCDEVFIKDLRPYNEYDRCIYSYNVKEFLSPFIFDDENMFE